MNNADINNFFIIDILVVAKHNFNSDANIKIYFINYVNIIEYH